jgi:hypothetical protein
MTGTRGRVQLLPDGAPLFVGCVGLQVKPSGSTRYVAAGLAASRLPQTHVAGALAGVLATQGSLSRDCIAEAQNHDGATFECAVTGQRLPLNEAHRVTIKQLLAWHRRQPEQQLASAVSGAGSGGRAAAGRRVPQVIRRAVPGIRSRQFLEKQRCPCFLLSWAYVCESAAVMLLRQALEVRTCCIAQARPSAALSGFRAPRMCH